MGTGHVVDLISAKGQVRALSAEGGLNINETWSRALFGVVPTPGQPLQVVVTELLAAPPEDDDEDDISGESVPVGGDPED